MFKHILALWLCASVAIVAGSHPYSHGPIGVMGDHTHHKGELMWSYRYMQMDMKDMITGTDDLSQSELFSENYMVAPTKMTMKMHMFGAMLGISDHTTLMAMVPYHQNSMSLTHKMQGKFSTETEGVGDVKLSALHVIKRTKTSTLHITNGISIPVGSIEERGAIPGNTDAQLPYPMQLGSGSLDYLLGVNWFGFRENGSWGAQLNAIFRMEENKRDYKLGNRYELTAWIAHKITETLSGSLRLTGTTQADSEGADSEIAMMAAMNPMASTEKGYTRIALGFGLNWLGNSGWLKDHRLALEWNLPIHQDVNGIQMKTESMLTLGWQYALH